MPNTVAAVKGFDSQMDETIVDPSPKKTASSRAVWLGGCALALVIVVGVPLFLRMPLWADPIQYDLAARNVLQGGVQYRDIADINLPGMVWLHVAIRALWGWGSIPLRVVDLLIVGAAIGLLVRWGKSLGYSFAARLMTAAILLAFYFSTSETSHCQRDSWLLLPAMAALFLRRKRLGQSEPRRVLASAVVEGLLWGGAFWVKPHVAIPALAVWLMSAIVTLRNNNISGWRLMMKDAAGMILGGLLVGAVGLAWVWWSGSWSYFQDSCFVWTRDYNAQASPFLERTVLLFKRFYPWSFIHLAAVPLACSIVLRACVSRKFDALQSLLAACYLGWFYQTHFIQLTHEYSWVPTTMLALVLVCENVFSVGRSSVLRLALGIFVAFALLYHPMLDSSRLSQWTNCWRSGNSDELRNRLTLADNPNAPDWVELAEVAAFLRTQQIWDGELTCNPASTQALYLELNIKPSTPYVNYDVIVSYFPNRVETVCRELSSSPQRFVVSDVNVFKLFPPPGPEAPAALNEAFPWTEPVVFRTRRYVVHRVTGPVTRLAPGSQVPLR